MRTAAVKPATPCRVRWRGRDWVRSVPQRALDHWQAWIVRISAVAGAGDVREEYTRRSSPAQCAPATADIRAIQACQGSSARRGTDRIRSGHRRSTRWCVRGSTTIACLGFIQFPRRRKWNSALLSFYGEKQGTQNTPFHFWQKTIRKANQFFRCLWSVLNGKNPPSTKRTHMCGFSKAVPLFCGL